MEYIIETDKLNLWYGAFQALIKVDLKVSQNKITGLIGPSGCGKSTLLALALRLNEHDSGDICLNGHDIRTLDLARLRERMGYISQEASIFTGQPRRGVVSRRPAAAGRRLGIRDVRLCQRGDGEGGCGHSRREPAPAVSPAARPDLPRHYWSLRRASQPHLRGSEFHRPL